MKKDISVGFLAPDSVAKEIFDQSLELTLRLDQIFEKKGRSLNSEALQETLITLTHSLLIGFLQAISRNLPDEELKEFGNQVFLKLGYLTIMEFIQREPSEEEWEYFLTYFRSRFELLRQELQELDQEFFGDEIPLEGEIAELLQESKKRLETILQHLFS